MSENDVSNAFSGSLEAEINGRPITVIFDPGSGVPEDAILNVSVIGKADDEYDGYMSDSAGAVGLTSDEVGFVEMLDISIIDPSTGESVEPLTPVQVRIGVESDELDDDGELSVVHIVSDDESEENECIVMDSVVTEDGVEFSTDGFSVYVIIEGPAPVNDGLRLAQRLSELPNNGFYFSIKRNNNMYYFKNELNARQCIARTDNGDVESAALWYFEPVENGGENEYYIYTLIDDERVYMNVLPNTYMALSTETATSFTAELYTSGTPGAFYIRKTDTVSTGLNYSGSNDSFKCYTQKNTDCKILLTYPLISPYDYYGLDGVSYTIVMHENNSVEARVLYDTVTNGRIDSVGVPVRSDPLGSDSTLIIAEDSNMPEWTFHAVTKDYYTMSVQTDAGVKYLHVNADKTFALTDAADATAIRVVPGTGSKAGLMRFVTEDGVYIDYNGSYKCFLGTSSPSSARSWFVFAVKSGLSETDFVHYQAQKVSVSDTVSVTNGDKIIIYTRVWNEAAKRYDFYAVDYNGGLVPCYEQGDRIQWVGTQLNTLIWDFTEYYYEGTNTPNYYYELKNEYSGMFIAPQIDGEQIFSSDVIGLNLTGRRDGAYYSPIFAWDDRYYAYSGVKIADGHITPGYMNEAVDFYFAKLLDPEAVSPLDVVDTLDDNDYGITMRLVDFGKTASDIVSIIGTVYDNNGRPMEQTSVTSREQSEVIGPSVYDAFRPTQGLLETQLGADGYPVSAVTGRSFSELYADSTEVNHLFDSSIYSGSGYYEFDSTQNFATLTETGDFRVYAGLGTMDVGTKASLKHGQFMPYNDIDANTVSSLNPENLYDAMMHELSNDDPRKHEPLYLVRQPNHYFGMEISARFIQTPNGYDDWGHDIIYEFTGDDDFWLYVDGELVIDLGGIHSAYPGSVNFATGQVSVNGVRTTLIDIFRKNYADRHGLALDDAAVEAYLDSIFEQKAGGQYVFKDYSAHEMRIFYMERGAGASNLHTRFNLASVKEGSVMLTKTLSGVDSDDYYMAEYPYQIWYAVPPEEGEAPVFTRLTEYYEGSYAVSRLHSSVPVHYEAFYTPPGGSEVYEDVFFLNADDTIEIDLPDEAILYYIVECGVNTEIYDRVTVNSVLVEGSATADEIRRDFVTTAASMASRPQVVFDNHISGNALRTLTITKRIFAADGVTPLTDRDSVFNFRLYLGQEGDTTLAPANMKAYCVKTPDGYYAAWDAGTQTFAATGYMRYDSIPEAEKPSVTFYTSPNGAISRIPADYHIEVAGLLVGTRFRVEERDYEIPEGYVFMSYERDADSYIIEQGDTPDSGTIRAGQSPAVEVHNRQVWDLTVQKIWSDGPYMDSHDDIFVGLYVGGELRHDTVRVIRGSGLTVRWQLNELEADTTFDDYEVRELVLTGEYLIEDDGSVTGSFTVQPLASGDSLNINAVTSETGTEESYRYEVAYETGSVSGVVNNIRHDTIRNSRSGIRIVKTDMSGSPVEGAIFTLKTAGGSDVGSGRYTSDEDGLVTTAYLSVDTEYVLTEASSPSGYVGMESPLIFSIDTDGTVIVVSGDAGSYAVSNGEDKVIVVKNKAAHFGVMKVKAADNTPLAGAEFALYAEITVNGVTRMDYKPLMTELVSGDDGYISELTDLARGTYYLVEISAPRGYFPIEEPIRFGIDELGRAWADEHENAELDLVDDGSVVTYTLHVGNMKRPDIIVHTGIDLNVGMIFVPVGIVMFAVIGRRVMSRKKSEIMDVE